jgi:nucleotide-binding universal stress UspA family protein
MKTLVDGPIATGVSQKPRVRKRASRSMRFNRILVPIDFSPPSLKAIPYALAISRQFGAEVHLLHVTDVTQQPPPSLLTLPVVPQTEWDQRFLKRLKALVLKYRTDGKVSALEPRTGVAYEEICAAARDLKADLIVVATHGYTGYKRIMLGSTAERVVQHSTCPVLVVRGNARHWNGSNGQQTRNGFQLTKILVPTDFSECSKIAFSYATGLTRDFKAELRLVHVINPHWYPLGDKYSSLDAAQLMEDASRAAHKQMRSMAATSNVRHSVSVIQGLPATEICHAANEDVDLIVISTHGRTGIGHILIGSIAEHVVRQAHCPVLVIPARYKF